jgi:hypothetical protein
VVSFSIQMFYMGQKCYSYDRNLIATVSYLHRSAGILVSHQVHMHIRNQLREQKPVEAESPVAGQ